MEELEIIARLQEIFSGGQSASPDGDLLVGIGDDAAFFRAGVPSHGVVIATDLLTEGTHFKREWSDLYSIGRKAAAANLADIYAMGAKARYLLVAVAFRPEDGDEIFELARGIADECARVDARVIGGDIARGSALTVSITALGICDAVITRSGAKAGDALYLHSGENSLPGRSFLGLEQLRREVEVDEASIDFHRTPKVEYENFISLAKMATSLCDISDGILSDAGALARASDVTIEIDSVALREHPGYKEVEAIAATLDLDPMQVVLTSGEEHSPLFTAEAGMGSEMAWEIGRVLRQGDALVLVDGQPRNEVGFKHF